MGQGPRDPFNPSVNQDPTPDASPSPDEVREEGQEEPRPVGPDDVAVGDEREGDDNPNVNW